MGSLRTRITIFITWLLAIAGTFVLLGNGYGVMGGILALVTLWMGVCMGLFLFAEPLPPRSGDICQRCGNAPAVVSKNYWATGMTIPDGGVKLCLQCVSGYGVRGDHRRDWSRHG